MEYIFLHSNSMLVDIHIVELMDSKIVLLDMILDMLYHSKIFLHHMKGRNFPVSKMYSLDNYSHMILHMQWYILDN